MNNLTSSPAFRRFSVCVLSMLSCASALSARDIVKPNVIIFYADDLGWQDTEINPFDEPVPWETPNIVKLASQSVNFLQGYSPAPTCSPSRGAILTGKHPVRLGRTHVRGGIPPFALDPSDTVLNPFYLDHLPSDELTIAEALQSNGYHTGHVGKWHCSSAAPGTQPADQGFAYTSEARGVTVQMKTRREGFATDDPSDPFRLDQDGRPYDEVTENALAFLEQSVEQKDPFFLYLAHWMVHAPIQTRDLERLKKYALKMYGVSDVSELPKKFMVEGQLNPYYAAMVDTLDWSLGRVMDYLEATPDPRNPGKTLAQTTYVIFSSDNGGYEGSLNKELITDNAPLDKGKIYAMEGGIRVPFLIRGPGIRPRTSQEIVSGLDFYPTILAITGTNETRQEEDFLDGVNLLPYLKRDAASVVSSDGAIRDTLYWNFPHGDQETMCAAIRSGQYKLYKFYQSGEYALYRLTSDSGKRADWEEERDLIKVRKLASVRKELIAKLEKWLADTDADPAYFNPESTQEILGKENVPSFLDVEFDASSRTLVASFEVGNGLSSVNQAYVLYVVDGGGEKECWYKLPATVVGNQFACVIPKEATHVVVNMIDENGFLKSSAFYDPLEYKRASPSFAPAAHVLPPLL
ncbi:MAG: sulfatase [Opitutaceae bacterium]